MWGYLQAPIVISFMYLGVLTVMAYELTRDVLRASSSSSSSNRAKRDCARARRA